MPNQSVRDCLRAVKHGLSGVAQQYYRLQTTYKPNGIVRERVFCYELYHQIRLYTQATNDRLYLHGEIDKRGHVLFEETDRKNPDFVFHMPGSMDGNTMVIEVKGAFRSKNSITKDFETLSSFISKYKYEYGVFLIYNYSLTEFRSKISSRTLHLKKLSNASNIVVLCKKDHEAPLEETTLASL